MNVHADFKKIRGVLSKHVAARRNEMNNSQQINELFGQPLHFEKEI